MNKLIKELIDAIENNFISYSDLTIFDDEIILIQLFASEQVTFNITAKNNYYYYIERDYYSEETGNNINSEEIFDKLEDVINFID